MGEDGGVVQKVLFSANWNRIFFPSGKAKTISMTHSDKLHRLDISTFYFDEPFLFKIFVPQKFIKTLAFPCLLSILVSTFTQATISINILIFFKYCTICMSFFNVSKYMLRFFIFKFDLNIRQRSDFFYQGPGPIEKNCSWKKIAFFCRVCKNYWITYDLHVVHTWHHMQSE